MYDILLYVKTKIELLFINKTMSEEKDNRSGSCVVATINLAFGIAEAVILSQNTGAKNVCGDGIWYNILMLCVFRFISVFVVIGYGYDSSATAPASLYTTVPAIWSMVSYFSISDSCLNTFDSNYSDLFKILKAEVILSLICFGIGALACCCFLCAVKYDIDHNVEHDNKNGATIENRIRNARILLRNVSYGGNNNAANGGPNGNASNNLPDVNEIVIDVEGGKK